MSRPSDASPPRDSPAIDPAEVELPAPDSPAPDPPAIAAREALVRRAAAEAAPPFDAELYRRAIDRAGGDRRLTFAEFMDLALYDPERGYYATAASRIGPGGDFITAPHLGSDFGELLAEQLAEMWAVLGQPQRFQVVEMGAGQGLLAGDILAHLDRWHPDCFRALDYAIVEKAAAAIAAQQTRLAPWGDRLRWTDLAALPPDSVTGVFLSNELVDALPVHRVTVRDGQLRELYAVLPDPAGDSPGEIPPGEILGDRAGGFRPFETAIGELSTPRLADYFALVGADPTGPGYPDGYETEVNLAALDWLAAVARALRRGYVLTVDYGYPAPRYYQPARSRGTLQCYFRHAHHDDPYAHLGHQDLTAHADFTALERHGDRCGLAVAGFVPQGLFLMALGLGDRIAALSSDAFLGGADLQAILRRRDSLHRLADPLGMGNFGVLVQSKGLSAAERSRSLRGLAVPPPLDPSRP